LKTALIAMSAVLFAAANCAFGAVLYLKNGDRVTGEVVGTSDGKTAFSTSMGLINVPSASILRVVEGDAPAEQPLGDSLTPSEVANASMSDVPPEDDGMKEDPYADLPLWMRKYKYFLQDNMPSGWKFVLRGGIQYVSTNSSVMGYSFDFSGEKEWDLNRFRFDVFYDYTTQTDTAGQESTTMDKYGIDTGFRRDITSRMRDPFNTGGEYKWFAENLLGYRRDMVKDIRHQVDEAITVGAEFKFPETGLTFSVAPGPAIRYLSAENYDQHWIMMAVVAQELNWEFSRLMRLEEKTYFGLDATDWGKMSVYFMVGLVIRATDVMDIALRYSYNYDSINASTALKTEERFTLSFEFPLY